MTLTERIARARWSRGGVTIHEPHFDDFERIDMIANIKRAMLVHIAREGARFGLAGADRFGVRALAELIHEGLVREGTDDDARYSVTRDGAALAERLLNGVE